MGPDGIHLQFLKDQVDEVPSLFPSYLKSHGNLVKFPLTGKEEATPIFKREKRGEPGDYKPVSLISVPGEILETLLKHMKNEEVTAGSQ